MIFSDGVIKKHCNNCDTNKPLKEFYKKKGKFRTPCKECSRLAGRKDARKRRRRRNETNRDFYQRTKKEKTQWLYTYLENACCIDCEEPDPIVLEFDHVRGFKYKGVAQLVNSLFSLDRLKEEIEKCEIVCANCHRRRTVKRCKGHRYLHFSQSP